MTDIQFDHYSHRVDHDQPVVDLTLTLLVNEDGTPEYQGFVQGFADGVMKLLRDLREKFPREKFDYYGIRFDEWLAGVPTQEPYLMSKEDLPIVNFNTPPPLELSREKSKLGVNKGVAPHVITRKYYPFAHCVSCNKKNTDYCRLVCEDESKIEEFSHEK